MQSQHLRFGGRRISSRPPYTSKKKRKETGKQRETWGTKQDIRLCLVHFLCSDLRIILSSPLHASPSQQEHAQSMLNPKPRKMSKLSLECLLIAGQSFLSLFRLLQSHALSCISKKQCESTAGKLKQQGQLGIWEGPAFWPQTTPGLGGS